MADGKRINPRKIPASKADVNRAFEQGAEEGMRMFLDVTLLTFDDMGLDDEFVSAFNTKFNVNLAARVSKRISTHDIRKALKDEKGWEIGII